jgi:hypothetical protein
VTNGRLNDFVFRGFLARHAILDLEARGILRASHHGDDERADVDLYAPLPDRVRESSHHMQRCYRLLYALENLVRDFVREALYEKDKDKWFEKRATAGMKKKVTDRRAAEVKNQWHAGRNEGEEFYLDFGDLGLLIINHWDVFKDLLPDQVWVTSRMQEAERSRHVVAHTNVLPVEEMTRLEQTLRDWIRQLG